MLKVHHLNCGTFCPYCRPFINGNGSYFAKGEMVCHCLLIETNNGLVLVDTGFGKNDIAQMHKIPWSFRAIARPVLQVAETAIEQIKGLGYPPDEVRHILPTHLHLDHIGGMSDFPQAKIHLFQQEYDAAMRPSRDYLPYQWEHKPDWQCYKAEGDKWFGFDSVRPLLGDTDDILMIPMHGHTAGHSAIAVKQGDQWLLHCGDSYYFHQEIKNDPPFVPFGLKMMGAAVNFNKKAFQNNQKRLRELFQTKRDSIRLFCAHDVEEFKEFEQ